MTDREILKERIRTILSQNNWDINLNNFPDLVDMARTMGLDRTELNDLVLEVDRETDKRPFEIVANMTAHIMAEEKGVFSADHAQRIQEAVKGQLEEHIVTAYIIYFLTRGNYQPRERVPPDYHSFRNAWMTDDAWEKYLHGRQEVEWLNEKAYSLEQLGEISFRKKDEAIQFLRTTQFLPSLVTVLTKSASQSAAFSAIIESEADIERRYLRTIYHLNPKLPFRFRGKMYASVRELLNDATAGFDAFQVAASVYRNGHINIWLRETAAGEKHFLTDETGMNGFLTFLYRVQPAAPFYLNGNAYNTPEQLAAAAKINAALWPYVAGAIENQQLQCWLDVADYNQYHSELLDAWKEMQQAEWYSDDEKKQAIVQGFIEITEGNEEQPELEVLPAAIERTSIEAGKQLTQTIQIKLKQTGFIKVFLAIEPATPGVTLSNYRFVLHGAAAQYQATVELVVDPMLLEKNRKYEVQVKVQTVYGHQVLPVTLKTVFPKKAFALLLLKYAGLAAVFMGLTRMVLQLFTQVSPRFADSSFVAFNTWQLPWHLLLFAIPLLLFVAGIYYGIRFIRKMEKI